MTPEQIAELEALAAYVVRLPSGVERANAKAELALFVTHNLPAILAALKAQQADAQAEPVAWLYEAYGVKQAYAYQLPDWSPSKGTETPLYVHPPKAQQAGEDAVERVARALCAADPEVRHGDAEGVVQQRVHIEWRQYAHAARAAIAAMQESRDAED